MVMITIVFLCLYYLKSTLDYKMNDIDWDSVYDVISLNYQLLVVVIILVPINWGIEALKWKWILKDTQNLSWGRSVKSVLSGVAMSIITPNGVGEYGGRMFGINRSKRSQALFYNGFLSISQLLTTIVFGLFGLLLISKSFSLPFSNTMQLIIIVVLISYGFWLYFTSKFSFWFIKSILQKYNLNIVYEISRNLRLQVLLLSILRYIVFCSQYYLLIICFKYDADIIETFSSIAFVYLCTVILPTGWFSGFIVRGSVSYFVFQSVLNSGEFGLVASSLLWLINLLLPALAGLYYIKSFKLFPIINSEII